MTTKIKPQKKPAKLSENPEKKFNLSNPGRIFYPKLGITKQELAQFYTAISKWALPYMSQRPLTLLRCPQGHDKECFYQKHLNKMEIKNLYTIEIQEKKQIDEYVYIKDESGIVSLVQIGVLEIHTWACKVDNVEKPDYITFDLDPAPDVDWKVVIKNAHFVREELEKLKLTCFIKTTGGKGLHVVLPIKRLYTWDEIRVFSQTFVEYLVSLKPNEFIETMTKAKRKGKIFIDYLRNVRGATAIAPYSTRANENATVSTPLFWDELTPRLKPVNFTVRSIPKRLASLKKDPWQDFYKSAQKLPFKK